MQNYLETLNASLKDTYSKSEISLIGHLILEKITGFSRTQLLVQKDLRLNENQRLLATFYIERLINNEPIQYILGETEFYGLKFKVNPSVLIPRPETEELVEWVISSQPSKFLKGDFEVTAGTEGPAEVSQQGVKVPLELPLLGSGGLGDLGGHKKEDLEGHETIRAHEASSGQGSIGEIKILDIGTGSGCIAIALKKKLPDAEVYAVDVSVDALKVAKENAELNDVKIYFIQDDILQSSLSYPKFDIIISNPPYIPISEKKEMDKNVTGFEPDTALFTPDNDPLLFYRTIAKFAQKNLIKAGVLYFETHRDYAESCQTLLLEHNFNNVEIRKDISGNDRMVKGVLET